MMNVDVDESFIRAAGTAADPKILNNQITSERAFTGIATAGHQFSELLKPINLISRRLMNLCYY